MFKKAIRKNATDLLRELKQVNLIADSIATQFKEQLDRIQSDSLQSSLSSKPLLSFTPLPISEWRVKNINQWADLMKETRFDDEEEFDIVEAIAVVRKAVSLYFNFNLTDIQILVSLITLSNDAKLKSESARGRLLQVATGEGKSIIVVILAIVSALREAGKGNRAQIDVITSSPVLAERDAKDKMKLYKMFNLTCSFNNDTSVYIKGKLISSVTLLQKEF